MQRAEAALDAREDETDERLDVAYHQAQDRFADCRVVSLPDVLLKLNRIAELEDLDGCLRESPNLLWPRILKSVLRDLEAHAEARAVDEPLLALWRRVRAAWAADRASDGDNGPTLEAYKAARAAFGKVAPTTTLGFFLKLLDSDDGDDFADDHLDVVESIIGSLLTVGQIEPAATPRAKAKQPVGRPTFAPCWSDVDAKRIACERWAPDSAWIVGCRLAVLVLAKTPDELIRSALLPPSAEGVEPAETVCNALQEAEEELESQLEVVRAAQARVLMSACYAHGVEIPK